MKLLLLLGCLKLPIIIGGIIIAAAIAVPVILRVVSVLLMITPFLIGLVAAMGLLALALRLFPRKERHESYPDNREAHLHRY